MAKSELMRPSWVSVHLCGSDTIAAIMLIEIMFRANVTKYMNEHNLLIVFSLQEWADNTGLSINQVRKALQRLTALNIIKTYNKKHPHKSVLRALHVEISESLWEFWYSLTSGGYKFQCDVLSPLADHIQFSISVAGCGQTIMYSENTPVCVEGTNLSIYKKKSKNPLIAAAHDCATANGQNQIKEEKNVEKEENEQSNINGEEIDDLHDISSSLKAIKTLPSLLMALHSHYVNYFWKDLPNQNKLRDDAFNSVVLWVKKTFEYFGEESIHSPSDKEIGLFILLHYELGEKTPALINNVIADWKKFAENIQAHYPTLKIPDTPDISFFYYFRQYAMSPNILKQSHCQEVAA